MQKMPLQTYVYHRKPISFFSAAKVHHSSIFHCTYHVQFIFCYIFSLIPCIRLSAG